MFCTSRHSLGRLFFNQKQIAPRSELPRRLETAADPLPLIRYHRKLARCTDAFRPHGYFAALA